VATSRDSADSRKIDWQFYLPVCLAIIFGALIVATVEDAPALRLILRGWADAALVLGGALIGLTGIVLEEIYRSGPERVRIAQEHEADHQRHREERRLDFAQYRMLQAELRETQSRADRLQAKLELADGFYHASGFPDHCTPETLEQLEEQLKPLGDDSERERERADVIRCLPAGTKADGA
jgi:hypothetical protein